jgi:hypothetical protein
LQGKPKNSEKTYPSICNNITSSPAHHLVPPPYVNIDSRKLKTTTSNDITFILNFVKIRQLFHRLKGDIETHINAHRFMA